MPQYSKDELIAMADDAAKAANVEPALLKAIIEQESGWNIYATRFEPAFYKRYLSKRYPEQTTESIARATSFGLCQLMGEVARELNFNDAQLSDLLDPKINLQFGLLKLKECLKSAKGDFSTALAKWNGGSNKQYPQQVLSKMSKYK